jgi:hypothetical protein
MPLKRYNIFMFKNIINWIKHNVLATIAIVIILISIKNFLEQRGGVSYSNMKYASDTAYSPSAAFGGGSMGIVANGRQLTELAPTASNNVALADRKVITEGFVSLQVDNVTDTISTIKTKVLELNGFVVNTNISRPEFGESATLSVRLPGSSIDSMVAFLRSKAVKVVSENISGEDITDQFVDTEARLAQLTDQLARYQSILAKAFTVEDIVKVEPYIQQTQNEIDSVKGQVKYMERVSSTSLLTIYLATDELSLPYQPANAWRPAAIFKAAARSLLGTLQTAGTALIWLAVYSVIIVPALTIVLIIYLVSKRKRNQA